MANAHAMRLKERALRLNKQPQLGNRLLRGMAALGGVRFDWSADQIKAIRQLVAWAQGRSQSLVQFDPRVVLHARPARKPPASSKPNTARDLGVVRIAGRNIFFGFDHDLPARLPACGLRPG